MLNSDIAIDFGTSTIRIYLDGKGVVVNEPAVMAVDNTCDEILGVGREAHQMIGRTSKRVTVENPFKAGIVCNYPMAEHMVNKYIKRIGAGKIFLPSAVVSVPVALTEVEKHAIIEVIEQAGIRKINLIQEPIAAAIGAGLDVFGTKGVMVVDVGAEKSTASIISAGRIHATNTINIGGNSFDDGIIRYIRKKYSTAIGKLSAEALKIEIGSASPREKLMYCHVKGRDLLTNMPKDISVTSDEMIEAIVEHTGKISDLVQSTLSEVSVALSGDIAINGIALVGGSAKIFGLDTVIERKTNIKVIVPDEPDYAVINGAGSAIKITEKAKKRGILSAV